MQSNYTLVIVIFPNINENGNRSWKNTLNINIFIYKHHSISTLFFYILVDKYATDRRLMHYYIHSQLIHKLNFNTSYYDVIGKANITIININLVKILGVFNNIINVSILLKFILF